MQFMLYGVGQTDAPGAPPSQEMLAQLYTLTEDSKKAGILVATGGLQPQGTRIRQSGGEVTVTDGPFIEAKELIAGFAILRVNTKEEAIEWAKRFRAIIGDGESEIVRIYGPSDFAGGQ